MHSTTWYTWWKMRITFLPYKRFSSARPGTPCDVWCDGDHWVKVTVKVLQTLLIGNYMGNIDTFPPYIHEMFVSNVELSLEICSSSSSSSSTSSSYFPPFAVAVDNGVIVSSFSSPPIFALLNFKSFSSFRVVGFLWEFGSLWPQKVIESNEY